MQFVAVWLYNMVALTLANVVLFALPPLISLAKQEWGLDGLETGFLMSAAYGGAMLASIWAGTLSSRFGVRNVVGFSLLFMGMAAALAGVIPNYAGVYLMMLLAGTGYAALNPAINQGMIAYTPMRLRGTGMSIKQMGITAGGAVSAFLLPPIALASGWRSGVAAAGMLVIGCSLILMVLATVRSNQASRNGMVRKTERVKPDLKLLLKHPAVISLSAAASLITLAQMSFFMYWALYLEEDRGLSFLNATQMLALAQTAGLVGRVLWGSISDGFFAGQRPRVLQGICAISAAMTFLLYFFPGLADSWILIIGVVLGFNMSGWGAVYQTALVESVPGKLAAAATGVSMTAVYTALFAGPVVFGVIKDWLGSYRQAWGMLTVGLLLAIVVLAVGMRFIREATWKQDSPAESA